MPGRSRKRGSLLAWLSWIDLSGGLFYAIACRAPPGPQQSPAARRRSLYADLAADTAPQARHAPRSPHGGAHTPHLSPRRSRWALAAWPGRPALCPLSRGGHACEGAERGAVLRGGVGSRPVAARSGGLRRAQEANAAVAASVAAAIPAATSPSSPLLPCADAALPPPRPPILSRTPPTQLLAGRAS